jgi:pyruvate/2-oxoglutarate/acetoin dehydrogenase E1 component
MAEMTYRAAVTRAIRQEMRNDERVFLIGEDVAKAGGVFKTTGGLLEEFGPGRVMDTPISEQAIIGAAMGAASAGLRPIAEIMFADFVGVTQDIVVNQIAKARFMSDGQVQLPLVIRFGSGGGLRFGAQHSQSVENWMMAIPGLKVVAPSTPEDLIGLFAAAVRDPDPVMFIEHKGLLNAKGEVRDGDIVDELGTAKTVRRGRDATVVAVGMMVQRSLAAAEALAVQGLEVEVVDLRSLVPLDVTTVLESVRRTGALFTVEENPRLCGWGAEVVSIAVEEAFDHIDGAPVRITTPHIPLAHAAVLEDAAIPSVDRIVETVSKHLL